MFDGVLQRFAERAPTSVMVRGLLERWFESTREGQSTRQILFSWMVGLMLQIVCWVQANVHAAYRESSIAAVVAARRLLFRVADLLELSKRVRRTAR